jgi:hypothetical protein
MSTGLDIKEGRKKLARFQNLGPKKGCSSDQRGKEEFEIEAHASLAYK